MSEIDEAHDLHGKAVIDQETFDYVARNIIVHEDGTASYVGWATATGEIGDFHAKIKDMEDKIEQEENWHVTDVPEDDIEDVDELKKAIDNGEFGK
mgnify:CR=1 FL=1|jgi:hypothetical protein